VPGENEFAITLRTGWNMVSTPVYGYGAGAMGDVLSAFKTGGLIVKTDCAATTLWNWNGKAYETPGRNAAGTTLAPMTGYWVYSAAPCTTIVQGDRGVDAEGTPLHAGWNQIGATNAEINFKKIAGNCEVRSGPWRYSPEAGKYLKAEVLKPGEGYFVKVAGNCVLSQTDANPPNPPSEDERNNGRAGGSAGGSSGARGASDTDSSKNGNK
jgi:hypothetical protein